MSALVVASLNERQSAFVSAYLRIGEPGKAALDSGYAHAEHGYALIRSPSVLAAVHLEMQRMITAESPASLRVLKTIREDENAPARVRADISLQLLKMAGHVVPSNKADKPVKQLSEMTPSELIEFIETNQAAIDAAGDTLAAKAKPVSAQVIAQDQVPTASKPLTFLD